MPTTAVLLLPLHATPGNQPAPFTPIRLLTAWTFDWWLVLGVLVPAALYVWGLVVLHRRGDRWPRGRSAAFLLGGMGSIVVATMSALGTYDTVLFSVHVVQHMILMMVTPMFLALGAPVTLALRTLPRRPRAVLLRLLHSWLARVLSFPPLALALFIATPFAMYYSPFYELSLRSAFWHAFMHLHFVIVGSMLMWPLMGVDPVPGRVIYPLRLLLMFLMLPSHAFLGISIMSAQTLIAERWYLAFNRSWPPSPLRDQFIAGGILWGSGDVIALMMLIALFVRWYADSQREARREDRRLDRLEAQRASAAEGPGYDRSAPGGRGGVVPPGVNTAPGRATSFVAESGRDE